MKALAVALLAALLVYPTAARAVEPPRNLADYVLFAFDDLDSKGFDIDGGAVGVNDGRMTVNGPINGASATLVADEVDLDQGSTCQELFANTVLGTGPGCQPAIPFTNPILADPVEECGYPDVFPACAPGNPITIAPGQSLTLPPGVYGALDMKNSGGSSATLRLTGGSYVFCSINGTRHGAIIASAATDVFVVGAVEFGPQSAAFTQGPNLHASDFRIFQAGTDLHAPHNAMLDLFVCAPNAHLVADSGAVITGRIVAKTIFTERVSLHHAPPSTTTSTTVPSSTTSTSAPAPTTTTSTAAPTTTTAAPTTTTAAPTTTTAAPTTTTAAPTTSTTAAPTTSTTAAPSTTTSTTQTAPTTSTTSTTMPCGNGMVDQDEPCDPSSPGGVFLCPPGSTCSASCTCNEPTTTTTEAQPTTTTSTTETPPSTSTTSTTLPETCGNGMVDQGEPCDPSSPGGAFLCPPGSICSAACTCQEGTTTSTTAAPTTTTTSTTPGGSTTSTSTTITGATTTSTTLPVEICGNCIDDDNDGAIDFEDTDCCGNDSTNGMEVTRSVFKRRGAKTRMKLRSIIGVEQTLCSLALTHDVFLQMKRSDGELLCAWVPAMKFMTMGKHMVSFWDLKERVESAKGIRDMAFTCKSDGAVRYYAKGPKVRFRTPGAGDVEITLGFRSPNGNAADNRCHAVVQEFRTAPNGLRAP